MATAPNQGIMALPENQEMQAPQLSLMDSYEAMQQGLKNARPDASMELEEALAEIRGELDELTDEQLTQLTEAVQGLYGDPQNYAKEVADMVNEGLIDADDLPAEYDEEFLASLLMVLVDAQRSRMAMAGSEQPLPEVPMGMPPTDMMPPQGFARGGIAEAARIVANSGRRGDTMLAHITPSEARLLKARGGSGTINPETGLPEFFIKKVFKAVGKVFKSVGKALKKVLSSPIGRILGTIALGMIIGPAIGALMPGLSATAAAGVTGAVASGTVTALAGGDLKSVLTSAVTGFMGAPGGPVSNFVGQYTGQFLTNPIVREAATGAIVGTGAGLVTGQSLKESLKSGLVEGAISGGMAFASGAPKTDVNSAAATAAADATSTGMKLPELESRTLDIDAQQYVKDQGGTFTPTSGAAGQSRAAAQAAEEFTIRPIQRNADGTIARDAAGNIVRGEIVVGGPLGATGQGISSAYSPSGGKLPALSGTAADIPPVSQAPSQFAPTPSRELVSDVVAGAQARSAGPGANIPVPGRTAAGQLLPSLDYAAPLQLEEGIDYAYRGAGPARAAGVEPYTPGGPEIGQSFSEMGAGAKKFMTGNFSEGASQFAKGAGDLFAPGPSKEQILDYAQKNKMSIAEAEKAISPGFFRTYGPGVAAGIGTLALTGGFTPDVPEPPEQGPTGADLLQRDPSRYLVQGLPGVQYGAQGNIMGGQPYASPFTMANIRVPSAYGSPAMFAAGGIAALAQGGYPRKVGQISGPGTEKSDSIPAMLSDGEFVMTAKAVRGAGGGSRREGAKRMYALMHQLERNAARG